MKLSAILVAGALALACVLAGPAFAQDIVAATAPVAVVASPATQEAVQEQAWWGGLASQAITALAGIAAATVAALAPLLFNFIRSKSKLAAVLVSQAMIDKLALGIENQIRAEAERMKTHLKLPSDVAQFSPATKQDLATAVQPKIEAAFKETLKHFDKKPGSQEVKDLILGRVETALTRPGSPLPGNAGQIPRSV